jgi:DNA (cytosine-5)-methyltransferase 1
MGYHRAGFCVTGVDVVDQPRYPFRFVQADAVTYLLDHGAEYAAAAGSPPCQFAARVSDWRGSRDNHLNLIPAVRDAMEASGRPWVIENVPEAVSLGPVRPDYLLCGTQFGLRVRRHRVFETSWRALQLTPPCTCWGRTDLLPFEHKNERAFADALGCTWMTNKGGRQAIPPAYTEYIGAALLAHLSTAAAA